MSELIPWFAPWTHRAIIMLLAVLGLYFAWVKGWRHKRLDHPACSKCMYDLRETPEGKPCPECGYDKGKRLTRWPLKRRALRSLPGLLLALLLPTLIVIHHTDQYGADYWLRWGPGYWMFGQQHLGTNTLGPFTLDWYTDRRSYGEQRLIIQPSDIELTGYGIEMWQSDNDGQDITCNGKPDLLLSSHSGRNSFIHMLLELEDGVVVERFTTNSSLSWCGDTNCDGIWEYYTTTISESDIPPEHYLTQRLDRLIEDQDDLLPWHPDWLEEK